MKKNLLLKIFLALGLLSLGSCQNFSKKNSHSEFKIKDDSVKKNDEQSYETINNEQDAAAFNLKNQNKNQEIEVQDRVFYANDSFELSEESKKILQSQVEWLKNDNKIKVLIEGHCDERGSREYNLALGERRANSAKNYLIDNGISQNRISIISYGKEKPALFGASEEVFAKNRRAVTVVK